MCLNQFRCPTLSLVDREQINVAAYLLYEILDIMMARNNLQRQSSPPYVCATISLSQHWKVDVKR